MLQQLKNHDLFFYYHTGLNIEDDSLAIKLPDKEKIDYKEHYLFLTGVFHQHTELRPTFYELNREIYNLYNDLAEKSIEKKELEMISLQRK